MAVSVLESPVSARPNVFEGDSAVEFVAERLVASFDNGQHYIIALSGGVDSSVVAKAASLSQAWVTLATAQSAAVSQAELADVRRVVELLRLPHQFVVTDETSLADYQANSPRRCYYCKSTLFAALRKQAPGAIIVTGTNADDLSDYRPGLQAAEEAQVYAPLARLGISKTQVRQIAKLWGLPVADKPASPCLASRIAHGVPVTPARLKMVEDSESLLRGLGLSEFRVRVHADELARIELPISAFEIVVGCREEIVRRLNMLGFRYVTLDLGGFRSGSLNPLVALSDIKLA